MDADGGLNVIIEHTVHRPNRDTPAPAGRQRLPGRPARATGPDLRQPPSNYAEVLPRIAVIVQLGLRSAHPGQEPDIDVAPRMESVPGAAIRRLIDERWPGAQLGREIGYQSRHGRLRKCRARHTGQECGRDRTHDRAPSTTHAG